MGRVIDGIFEKADAFLLGRTTYDIFAAYWPRVTDPNGLVASKLNSLPNFVHRAPEAASPGARQHLSVTW
jgi:dihydrofolate reductase